MFCAGPLLHCQRLKQRLLAFTMSSMNKSSAFKNENPRGNNEHVKINLKEKAANSVRRKETEGTDAFNAIPVLPFSPDSLRFYESVLACSTPYAGLVWV